MNKVILNKVHLNGVTCNAINLNGSKSLGKGIPIYTGEYFQFDVTPLDSTYRLKE